MNRKKTAYFSVSDKTGVVDFAFKLSQLGYTISASGGTANLLKQSELEVEDVRPGDPATILAVSAGADDPIDIAVVNLYPLAEILQDSQVSLPEVLEFLDAHSVSVLRAAAKNFDHVVTLCDPRDYSAVLESLEELEEVKADKRRQLAAKAFHYTAYYDSTVAQYLGSDSGMQGLSDDMVIGLKKVADLRYGENPHQQAAIYRLSGARPWGLAAATLLHGKPLNYVHFLNLEASSELVAEFTEPACAIVKHMNPAGVAEGRSLGQAAKLAYAADPRGCSGGVAAFNREVDGEAAKALAPQYLECIVASRFSPDALDILRQKKDVRLISLPSMLLSPNEIDLRPVSGGLLIQDKDNRTLLKEVRPVSRRPPGPSEIQALEFAWRVVKHAKTHAAVLTRGTFTLGIGCGQSSRLDAVRLAIVKSQERHPIVTPDAPMVLAADGPLSLQHVLEAAEAGVTAIIESGGSSEDKEAIEACDAKSIAMAFTGIRHYRH